MNAETFVDIIQRLLKKERPGANSAGCQSGANFRFCSFPASAK